MQGLLHPPSFRLTVFSIPSEEFKHRQCLSLATFDHATATSSGCVASRRTCQHYVRQTEDNDVRSRKPSHLRSTGCRRFWYDTSNNNMNLTFWLQLTR